MDFRLSAEQGLLQESARRYFDARMSASDDAWERFAELGWLAMALPESAGGLDAAVEDMAVLCEVFGHRLVTPSFVHHGWLPGAILRGCPCSVHRDALLTALGTNRARLALACYEPGRRYSVEAHCRAEPRAGDGWRISGHKTRVGAQIDVTHWLVSVSLARPEELRPALVVISADAPGIERRVFEAVDGTRFADLELCDVEVTEDAVIAQGGVASEALDDALDAAGLGVAADLLGALERALDLTVDYLKIRRQFGRPLAEFQVLQHAVAEMAIDAGSARSSVYRALAAHAGARRERQRAVSAALVKLIDVARSVAGAAVHLHGGIGVTQEYPAGRILQRVLVAERLYGDRDHHLARYQRLRG